MLRLFSLRASCALVVLLVPAALHGANKTWTAAVSGDFADLARWTGGVPGAGDSATFNVAGAYTVTFDNSPNPLVNPVLNQDLFFQAGTVTFTSGSGGPYTYRLTGAGGDDAFITGGALTLGTSGNPLHLTVDDDLVVRGGSTLNINFGSQVNTTDLLVATVAASGNGTVVVDGTGSTLNLLGASTVGSAAGGIGNLNIGTIASGAVFNTGTGLFTINNTGTVSLGNGAIGGTLNANGNVVVDGGVLQKANNASPFNLAAGNTMTIQNGGLVSFNNYITAANAVYNVTGAGSELETFGGALTLNNGAQITVSAGGSVSISSSGSFFIATNGNGTLAVNGAGSAVAGFSAQWGFSGNTADVTFSNGAVGSFSSLTLVAGAVAGTTTVVDVLSGADLNIAGNINLATAGASMSSATLSVQGAGSTVAQSGSGALTVGHSSAGSAVIDIGTTTSGASFSTGTSAMTINATGTINVGAGANTGTLDVNGDVNINGGALTRGSSSAFNLRAGRTMTIQNGGRASFTGSYTTAADAIYNVTGAGSELEVLAGNLIINDGAQVNLDSGGTAAASGSVVVSDAGTLHTGSSINSAIAGTSADAVINVNASGVSLGSAASLNGFSHQGILNIGANAVTLNSAGYARLGALTTLNNGSIDAPNGVVFASGSNFLGHGAVNARISGEAGAVIEADDALALGDAASPAGFNFGGELRTRQHAVTLNSSAQALLGDLTTLGEGASAGALNAANGLVVDFGDAITGHGTINSTNTLAKRTIINGIAQGNSMAEPLTFTGYVKGVGTFDNVTFTGTYDPGLSPTLTTVGSITFGPSNTLITELGGTSRGDEYDAILASGTLGLGGTLQVTLINGFTPSAGNTFDFFDWAGLAGTFDTLQLPALSGSLVWDTTQLYTTGMLLVAAPGLPGDYNLDGSVDAADYVVWRKGAGVDPTQANYNLWRTNFGRTSPGAGAGADANSAVPEPATLVLLILAAIGRCLRRRRSA